MAKKDARVVTYTGSRFTLVENAMRWARNILVEILSNHGEIMSTEQRAAFRKIMEGFSDFELSSREPEQNARPFTVRDVEAGRGARAVQVREDPEAGAMMHTREP